MSFLYITIVLLGNQGTADTYILFALMSTKSFVVGTLDAAKMISEHRKTVASIHDTAVEMKLSLVQMIAASIRESRARTAMDECQQRHNARR